MSDLKPELSKKNPYYISKHRRYELVHYCLQYPIWRDAMNSLSGLAKRPDDLEVLGREHDISDPTAKTAMARAHFAKKMYFVERAAKEADEELYDWLMLGVTEGKSYGYLQTHGIPCSETKYYQTYRKFFWILSRIKD